MLDEQADVISGRLTVSMLLDMLRWYCIVQLLKQPSNGAPSTYLQPEQHLSSLFPLSSMFCTVQSAQYIPPQLLQWCLRTERVNCIAQQRQRSTSLSSSHNRKLLLNVSFLAWLTTFARNISAIKLKQCCRSNKK